MLRGRSSLPLPWRPWASIAATAYRSPWPPLPTEPEPCRVPGLKVTVGGHGHPCRRPHRSLSLGRGEGTHSFTAFRGTRHLLSVSLKTIYL